MSSSELIIAELRRLGCRVNEPGSHYTVEEGHCAGIVSIREAEKGQIYYCWANPLTTVLRAMPADSDHLEKVRADLNSAFRTTCPPG